MNKNTKYFLLKFDDLIRNWQKWTVTVTFSVSSYLHVTRFSSFWEFCQNLFFYQWLLHVSLLTDHTWRSLSPDSSIGVELRIFERATFQFFGCKKSNFKIWYGFWDTTIESFGFWSQLTQMNFWFWGGSVSSVIQIWQFQE